MSFTLLNTHVSYMMAQMWFVNSYANEMAHSKDNNSMHIEYLIQTVTEILLL